MDREREKERERERERAAGEEELRSWFATHLPDVPDDVRFDGGRRVVPAPRGTAGRRTGWLYAAGAVAAAAAVAVAPHFLGPAGAGHHPGSPATGAKRETTTPPNTRTAQSGVAAPLPPGMTFRAVDFPTPSLGLLAGTGGIFETTDGGTAWTRVYRGAADLSGIQMVNARVGYAWTSGQGGAATILTTTDGGGSWTRAGSVPAAVQDMSWPAPRVGYAVTSQHALMKTTDGGRTWSALRQKAVSVSFLSADKGYALDGPDVYATVNGGASWTAAALVSPATQVSGGEIRATPDGSVWADLVGGYGMSQASYTVFRSTDGVQWAAVIGLSTAGGGPAPGSPSLSGPGASPGPIDPLSKADAFITGTCSACQSGASQVVGTTTGGRSWSPPPVQAGPIAGLIQSPDGISFASPSTGYAVASAFPPTGQQAVTVVYKTTDGGDAWTVIYNGGS